MIIGRRGLLTGLVGALFAPALVRAESIMKVKPYEIIVGLTRNTKLALVIKDGSVIRALHTVERWQPKYEAMPHSEPWESAEIILDMNRDITEAYPYKIMAGPAEFRELGGSEHMKRFARRIGANRNVCVERISL